MKKRVLVAMSGGVDSSVAAAILQECGYETAGATFITDSSPDGAEKSQDVYDAKNVADKLGIPHHTYNISDIFKRDVIDYFINEYLCGRTPNPCVMCNKKIKFGIFLQKALELGYDYIATGHYASILTYNEPAVFCIAEAADKHKDQSYVLYSLNQDILRHTLLPLGRYTKEEIRRKANEYSFDNAGKSDSQDICFIKDGDYAKYIREHSARLPKSGNFVDKNGNILGKHKGIWNYTVGQRKGLNISHSKPLYVCAINPAKNEIILGDNKTSTDCTVKDVSFISGKFPAKTGVLTIKVRYNGSPVTGSVEELSQNEVSVKFNSPVGAVTPGQSAVFYDGNILLGGGIISGSRNNY